VDGSETGHKKGRKLKFSHILIVLLLIIVGAFVVFRLSVRSKLRARIDAIRAAGYPVTLAELNEWYTIPEDAENAADKLIEAFLNYYEWNRTELESLPIVGRAELPARTEPLAEETKVLVAQYIADNQQAIELLYEAAAIKHCRYLVDLSIGLETQMPYFSDIKGGAQLLSLEAVLHAENNKPQLAARSVTSIFGIAHSLAEEPLLISQLVCTACQGLAVSSLERIINRVEFTDDQLVNIGQAIAHAEDPSNMSRALAGERCFVIDTFKLPYFKIKHVSTFPSRKSTVGILSFVKYKAIGTKSMDLLTYLDLLDSYIRATQLSLHLRQDAVQAIEAKLRTISKAHIFLHLFPPTYVRDIIQDLANIAYLRAARASLAVQRYRLATGNLPDTLADLVPTYLDAVPEDPFDGRTLRYEKLETGFVVYSIGEDGRDDGGKERLPTGERKEAPSSWDITFIVER